MVPETLEKKTVWEKGQRVWSWRWISFWPRMREWAAWMKGKQIFREMEEIVLWLDFSWTSLSFGLSLFLSLPLFFIKLTPFCLHTPLSYVITTRVEEDGPIVWDRPLLRGWKRGRIQVMWYQSIITFQMALHPWMINGYVFWLGTESQHRHSGQRPLEMIWRTSKALCYHLPTRQTLSSCFLGHGNNMSLAFTQ